MDNFVQAKAVETKLCERDKKNDHEHKLCERWWKFHINPKDWMGVGIYGQSRFVNISKLAGHVAYDLRDAGWIYYGRTEFVGRRLSPRWDVPVLMNESWAQEACRIYVEAVWSELPINGRAFLARDRCFLYGQSDRGFSTRSLFMSQLWIVNS